jgi:poly(A) polymerase
MDRNQLHNPFLDRLTERFAAAGHRLYLVGGVVRDVLAGHPPGDMDLATDAPVEAIKRLAAKARPQTIYAVGEKFGTVGVIAGEHSYEITTFRRPPGGEPPPMPPPGDPTPPDLYADLAYRDFTMNALAYDLATAMLYDPFDGRADLAERIVRGVGDPAARFAEDPQRMLRAVRLAVQIGGWLDLETRAAATALAPLLATVAWERKAAEMNRILMAPRPSPGIRLLDDLGLLAQVIPEITPMHGMAQGPYHYKDVYEHTLQVVDRAAQLDDPAHPDLILRWAALLHDIAKPRTFSVQDGEVHFFGHEVIGAHMAREILIRLRQPQEVIAQVEQLVAQHLRIGLYDDSWTDGAVRRFIRESAPVTERLIALARADVTSANPRRVAAAGARVDALMARCAAIEAQEEVAKIKSPLDGNELMALFDRPPGPWIRPLKDYLLNLVLDGQPAQDDVATATTLARAWIAEHDEC